MKFVQTNRMVCVFFMHPRILGIMFSGCLSVCASVLAYIRRCMPAEEGEGIAVDFW